MIRIVRLDSDVPDFLHKRNKLRNIAGALWFDSYELALAGVTPPSAHASTHAAAGSDPITISESQVTGLIADLAAKIAKSIGTAKGDLIGFTASATPTNVAIGTDGWVLVADAASAAGFKWAAVSASVSDGDKGDISVTSSGTVWTIDNGVVTYAKIQNVSATSRLLGRVSGGAGVIEEIVLDADGTLAANSDIVVATQKAIKTYVDTAIAAAAVPDASETVKGKAEIATQAETNTGTDDLRIVTPLKLKDWWTNIKTLDATISGGWTFTKEIVLQDISEPVTPTNQLYSVGGEAKWNGEVIVLDNDARLSDARAVLEVAEASLTNNSAAAVDLTVAATADRLYTYFTLPTTEKLYKITGIEWKNGTSVAGNTQCGAHLVDASPPVGTNIVLCAVGQAAANTGSGSVQRVSIINAPLMRGGTIIGVYLQCDDVTHQYRSVTLGASIKNRKGVTLTFAPTTQDVTSWTSTTKGIYVKLYFTAY